MKKLIAFLLCLALAAVLLGGCGKQMGTLGDGEHAATHFSVVDEYDGFMVVVDTDTGVMYAMSISGGAYGVMQVLLNWDGSPRVYPAYDAREDRTP